MEAQARDGGGGGGGGGQVRKVHIVYFISRRGHIEHPHLIRVHHLSRNGVRLRDVKRWLSELRGKDMPESFAWSYKRKYKAGYVWQDLLDEDLITPICDNEYVLKGSEISSISFTNDLGLDDQKDVLKPKKPAAFQVDVKDPEITKDAQENSLDNSTKTSFEIEESPSFGSETSVEDTTKHEEDCNLSGTTKHEEHQRQNKIENNTSLYKTLLKKNKTDNKNKKGGNHKETSSSKASPSSNPSFGKSSSYSSSGVSHMFLNLITCGIVDTNESAVTTIKRRRNGATSMTNVSSEKNTRQVVKGDKLGGSERFSRVHWSPLVQQRNSRKEGSKTSKINDSNNTQTFPVAYKPVNGPYCSQCGKQFKPEKLHTHMTSCKGMKALAKSAKSKS